MIIKTTYIANDGTPFATEQECLDYEASRDREIAHEVNFLNRVCKFFDTDGKQVKIDHTFNESNIYAVRIIHCTSDEADDVETIFRKYFNDLYYSLLDSDFGCNHEVILAYDWTDKGSGWTEIDHERKEWFEFLKKVLEGA